MNGKKVDRFHWRLPLYGSFGAVVVLLPKIIFGNDFGAFLATALLAATVLVMLCVIFLLTVRRQSFSAISMMVIFGAVCCMLFSISNDVRTTCRWLVQQGKYKSEIVAQPNPPNGQFKHTEWDGWGFAGTGDTTVYLVFDPDDSLAIAAKSHSPGKYRGIPCEVLSVRRLQENWYTVIFYTDTDWNHCG